MYACVSSNFQAWWSSLNLEFLFLNESVPSKWKIASFLLHLEQDIFFLSYNFRLPLIYSFVVRSLTHGSARIHLTIQASEKNMPLFYQWAFFTNHLFSLLFISHREREKVRDTARDIRSDYSLLWKTSFSFRSDEINDNSELSDYASIVVLSSASFNLRLSSSEFLSQFLTHHLERLFVLLSQSLRFGIDFPHQTRTRGFFGW